MPPVQHPYHGPLNLVTLHIELDPGLPVAGIESPYHPIHVTALAGGLYDIALTDGAVPADRDFELVWEPLAGAAPTPGLLTEAEGTDGHALLVGVPPAPAPRGPTRVPREGGVVL